MNSPYETHKRRRLHSPVVSRAPKYLVAITLLALAAGASGCGEDRSNLIPSTEAKQIEASLTGIEALAETNCFKALTASKAVQRQVESLPASVDSNLKRSLLDGVVNLQVMLGDASKCTATGDTTEPAPTGTTDTEEVTPTGDTGVTTPEETEPEEEKDTGKNEPAKKPETPTPKPTPTPEPDPKPTPETPPNTEPPPDPGPGSGGVSPDQ